MTDIIQLDGQEDVPQDSSETVVIEDSVIVEKTGYVEDLEMSSGDFTYKRDGDDGEVVVTLSVTMGFPETDMDRVSVSTSEEYTSSLAFVTDSLSDMVQVDEYAYEGMMMNYTLTIEPKDSYVLDSQTIETLSIIPHRTV